MEKKIQKLKMLNAAHIAATEFDYCPPKSKWKEVIEMYDVGVSDEELKKALQKYSGERPDEIMNRISELILKL